MSNVQVLHVQPVPVQPVDQLQGPTRVYNAYLDLQGVSNGGPLVV